MTNQIKSIEATEIYEYETEDDIDDLTTDGLCEIYGIDTWDLEGDYQVPWSKDEFGEMKWGCIIACFNRFRDQKIEDYNVLSIKQTSLPMSKVQTYELLVKKEEN